MERRCDKCEWCSNKKMKSYFLYYESDGNNGSREVRTDAKLEGVCRRFPKWRTVKAKHHYCGEFKEKE